MKLHDKTALITGAGSGIGRAMAYSLAQRGCHLALVDLHAEGLEETAKKVEVFGVKISTIKLDVTNRSAIEQLPSQVFSAHSAIHILVNNAGISAGGTFLQISASNFDRVMDVNFHAMVNLTRVFLPHLQAQEAAKIVNISSIFGIISPADKTAYSASKFAVRGFSNALRFELEGSNVSVAVVHPGGVATNIIDNTFRPEGISEAAIKQNREAQKKLLRLAPAKAGEKIVRGIERDKARILVGFDAKAIAWIERLLPVNYWKVMKVLIAMKQR